MNHASLFTGIGGFDLAAEWMGWNNVFQVEIDPFCTKVLEKNFPNAKRYGDIKQFDGKPYRGAVDVLSGGFPCQPYSIAGSRKGTDDDRHLWPEMLRVISEVRPAFVVGENVFGIVSISLDQVLSDLETIGYTTETFIVPACAVNAPHRRDRVWIIGYTEHAGFDATENGKGSIKRSNGDTERKDKICEPTRPTLSRDDVAYTNSNGQQRQGKLGGRLHTKQSKERKINRIEHDSQFKRNWVEVASELCRVDDGLPNRVDRIKSLGNAIVPQVAYEIFKALEQTMIQEK